MVLRREGRRWMYAGVANVSETENSLLAETDRTDLRYHQCVMKKSEEKRRKYYGITRERNRAKTTAMRDAVQIRLVLTTTVEVRQEETGQQSTRLSRVRARDNSPTQVATLMSESSL